MSDTIDLGAAPAGGPAGQAQGGVPPSGPGDAKRLVYLAVAVLAATGWFWLVLAVAAGGMASDMGPGMMALAPLLDRIAVVAPGLAQAGGGHGALMPSMGAWGAWDLVLVLVMWIAMVFAMMVPTALPSFRVQAAKGSGAAGVVVGYVAVWAGTALLATAAQWGLTTLGALAPHMAPAGVALSASVLVAAGLYQFTPLKFACLVRCRNPHAFALDQPRFAEALRLGVDEGLACLGCCWAMMAVMLAAGLMNLGAMALLGALMALEKVASGLVLTRLLGVIFLLGGAALASGPLLG